MVTKLSVLEPLTPKKVSTSVLPHPSCEFPFACTVVIIRGHHSTTHLDPFFFLILNSSVYPNYQTRLARPSAATITRCSNNPGMEWTTVLGKSHIGVCQTITCHRPHNLAWSCIVDAGGVKDAGRRRKPFIYLLERGRLSFEIAALVLAEPLSEENCGLQDALQLHWYGWVASNRW